MERITKRENFDSGVFERRLRCENPQNVLLSEEESRAVMDCIDLPYEDFYKALQAFEMPHSSSFPLLSRMYNELQKRLVPLEEKIKEANGSDGPFREALDAMEENIKKINGVLDSCQGVCAKLEKMADEADSPGKRYFALHWAKLPQKLNNVLESHLKDANQVKEFAEEDHEAALEGRRLKKKINALVDIMWGLYGQWDTDANTFLYPACDEVMSVARLYEPDVKPAYFISREFDNLRDVQGIFWRSPAAYLNFVKERAKK